jgi:hypothetical protein
MTEEFWKDLRENLKNPEFEKAYRKESERIRKFDNRMNRRMAVRDWLERQRWYWISINLSFNVFPWHWEVEYTRYKWGVNIKFGPFGLLFLWR